MLEVRNRPLDASDIDAQLALARTAYDDPLAVDRGHFWWKHGLNPCGPSVAVGLFDDERIVGRSLLQRRDFRIDSKTTRRAALVTDLLIAPDYRSTQNFLSLVAGQSDTGVDLLIHTSNQNSDILYRRLLEYPVAFNLKAFALPLRGRRILQSTFGAAMPEIAEALSYPWRVLLRGGAALISRLAGLHLEEGLPDEAEFERSMKRFHSIAGPHFDRTYAFLQWRFERGPVFRGRIETLRIRGEVQGYVAWRNLTLEGLEFLVLMDMALAAPLSPLAHWALCLELAERGAETGADLIFVMVNPANKLLAPFADLPLIPVPDSRLPHLTPLYVLPQREELRSLQTDASTYLMLADIDYF